MKAVIAALILMAPPLCAEDVRLDGPAITLALADRALIYDDGATQVFRAGGETIYDSGSPSTGRWGVREDRYCSVWPPSDHWACYDLTRKADGRTLTFVADDSSTTSGHYAP